MWQFTFSFLIGIVNIVKDAVIRFVSYLAFTTLASLSLLISEVT
jgi:hypothetical protein